MSMLGSSAEVPAEPPKVCGECNEEKYTRPAHCDSPSCQWWTCKDCGFTNNDKGRARKFAKGA